MTRTTLLTALSIAQLFAAEPYIGAWKLDLAKSTFSPGPPPISQLLRLDEEGGMVRLQLTESSAAGTSVVSTLFRFDGKSYPVQGSKVFDSVSATVVRDERARGGKQDASQPMPIPVMQSEKPPSPRLQLQFNWMRNGKTQFLCNGVHDGDRMTISTTGTGPDGKPVKNYRVFVKQK